MPSQPHNIELQPPCITLMTDFGAGSSYVATMKGVILSICPQANIVDITHAISPQDVWSGSLTWRDTTPWYPRDTLHVAVVDPGVGTSRAILLTEMNGQRYIAPDNGLISHLAARHTPSMVRRLENPEWFLSPVSATFHGRDIMAPVAAHLAAGILAEDLGPVAEEFVLLEIPPLSREPRQITGHVEWIDSFGNVLSDISRSALPDGISEEELSITCGDLQIRGLSRTYGDEASDQPIALWSSSSQLEIALPRGNAARTFSITCGAEVRLRW